MESITRTKYKGDSDTVDEESQSHEHDLQSLTWRNIEIDENKMAALKEVIEEIVNSTDDPQKQIFEAANAIFEISSRINLPQNDKEDFEWIMGRASILVVVLWESYKKSKGRSRVWPPPKLTKYVDHLVETVHHICRLTKRKSKNLAKRIFRGYVLLDLGKFKKYEQSLDSVAENLEKRPSNIKINELLLEVFDRRAQHHDDAEPSEQSTRGDLLDKGDTQRRATIHELPAEGSNRQHKAIAAAKPTNRKTKSGEENEVDETKPKASEKIKNKVINDSEALYSEVQKKDEDAHGGENKGKKKEVDDVEEGTSGQGFLPNKAGPTKARQRLSQTLGGEESTGNEGPSKKRKPTTTPKQNVRRQTAPPQPTISSVSINNHGSGTMNNNDIGNIYHSTISNVGNNNSRNYFPRRKPTYAG